MMVSAEGSVPIRVSDADLAAKTDHVLVGRVVGVDVIDEDGKQVKDENARTGPGSRNVIRLKVKVEDVLVTNAAEVPKVLYIPLDRMMHYSYGQVKGAHQGEGRQVLFLLTGAKFEAPVPGVFRRDLSKKGYFLNQVRAKHLKAGGVTKPKQGK